MYKKKYLKYKNKYLESSSSSSSKLKMEGGSDLISIAWELIINFSSSTRAKTKNFDGLKYWNEIKPFLETFNEADETEEPIEWNPKHDEVKKFVYDLELQEMDGETLIEPNHFILQQANIVKKNKPVFSRLMQIALNIGQGLTSPIPLSDSNNDIINKLNMYDIDTYMTQQNYMKFKFSVKDFIKLSEMLSELSKHPPTKIIVTDTDTDTDSESIL